MSKSVINILTPGFTSPNGRAFLMPLIMHERLLSEAGIKVNFHNTVGPDLTDCDYLMLDSKYYTKRWGEDESEGTLEEIAGFAEQARHVLYMDILDSSTWVHARALPYVRLYCKSQLLCDRTNYLKPLYGYRIFSDYYHRTKNVIDDKVVWSEAAGNERLLDKLTLSWNSGLADYSWLGPYRMATYQRLPWRTWLKYSADYCPPSISRERDMQCRIGTRYSRASIAYQRVMMKERLSKFLDTVKLSRRKFLKELRASKISISPFGFGEITLRDFETFMAGTLLLKPDMSHMQTWPDFYRPGETIVCHKWDLSDLEDVIETVLSDYEGFINVAHAGQEIYSEHLIGPEAGQKFVSHLQSILDKCEKHI